nr:S24/S26 family peptidase [Lachnospiraceae bacterium]
MADKTDAVKLLKEGGSLRISPVGDSMLPLLRSQIDEVVIAPTTWEEVKKNDIVLFRGNKNLLTLHRVCRIDKDCFYAVGDGQTKIEGPVDKSLLYGKVNLIIKN